MREPRGRAPASTTPDSRLHHLLFFFSAGTLSLYHHPRRDHSLLTKTVQHFDQSPAHSYIRSTSHSRCVRTRTRPVNPSTSAQSTARWLCDTNLQLPGFSSLHTFSRSKPITRLLSTSRLSSTCRHRGKIYTSQSPSRIHNETINEN